MYLKKSLLFALLFSLSVTFADENEDSDEFTVQLNDSNFDELIKTNNFFVKFYAPW